MPEKRSDTIFLRRAYAVTVVLLFLYFQFWQVNFYLAQSIKDGVYLFVPPVLIAGVLYFRRLRDGIEVKLVAAYLIWVVITRVLNGDRVLERQYVFLLDLALALPFLSLGLVLDDAGRRRVLNWLSAILGAYGFAAGILCLYSFLTRNSIINPITGGNFVAVDYVPLLTRIVLLDTNPNVVAYWFMIPMMLMCYQFFACRNKLWRIPIVLIFAVCFLVISVTYCRNAYLASSVCFALLVFLLLCEKWKRARKGVVLLLLVTSVLLFSPLFYLAYSASGDLIEAAAERIEQTACVPEPTVIDAYKEEAHISAAPLHVVSSGQTSAVQLAARREKTNDLNKISSGRLSIYRAALEVLRRNPRMLLVGCPANDVTARTNVVLEEMGERDVYHLHNFLLQTLLLTGVPGLVVVVAFCLLLVLRFLRLCFALNEKTALSDCVLGLPIISCLAYGLLESGFFNYTDARTLYFYLMCGMFLGSFYDSSKR